MTFEAQARTYPCGCVLPAGSSFGLAEAGGLWGGAGFGTNCIGGLLELVFWGTEFFRVSFTVLVTTAC